MEIVGVRAQFLLRDKPEVLESKMLQYCWDIMLAEFDAFPNMNLIEADVLIDLSRFEGDEKPKVSDLMPEYSLEIVFIPDEVPPLNFEFWRTTILDFIKRLEQAYHSISVGITEGSDVESLLGKCN